MTAAHKFAPARHHRRSIRLKGYDYTAAGAYFVTLVTHQRGCIFGEIVADEMWLNALGEIVAEEWERTPTIRAEMELDEWVVMPNHIHGIVVITTVGVGADVGADGRPPLQRAPKSLGAFVAGFKSVVTKRINEHRATPGQPVWQRNYYEHIIRNEAALAHLRAYIHNNPLKWALDNDNPNHREVGDGE
jgi:REP element-mobilizing transposase RayT